MKRLLSLRAVFWKGSVDDDSEERVERMKKALVVTLTEEELLDLERILLDEDEQEALRFLKGHLKHQVRDALEGG